MFPITVLVGQIGHALAGLLLTRDRVTIMIGTGKLMILKTERLTFDLSIRHLWFGYTCLHERQISHLKQAIFAVSGPIFALILGISALTLFFSNDVTTIIRWIALFYFFDAIAYFLLEMIPSQIPRMVFGNGPVYNQGHRLKILWDAEKLNKFLIKANQFFHENDRESAEKLLEEAGKKFPHRNEPYIWLINTYFNFREFEKVITVFDLFEKKFSPDSTLYNTTGLAHSFQDNHDLAMEFFKKAVEKDENNVDAKSNIGYTHMIQERFNEAIIIFNDLMVNNPQSSYLLSNRGLAKYKSGNETEGLADMKAALALPDPDAFSFRNMGIYHLEKNEREKAMKFFQKAKEIEPMTHLLEHYIEQADKTDPAGAV